MTYPVSMHRFHSTRLMEKPASTRHEVYMAMARFESRKTNCGLRSVGCLLVDKFNKILSTGYNYKPPYTKCECKGITCKSSHAEMMALMNCKDVEQITTCYTTLSPCYYCIRALMLTPCHSVIFEEEFQDRRSKELWLEAGREWVQL